MIPFANLFPGRAHRLTADTCLSVCVCLLANTCLTLHPSACTIEWWTLACLLGQFAGHSIVPSIILVVVVEAGADCSTWCAPARSTTIDKQPWLGGARWPILEVIIRNKLKWEWRHFPLQSSSSSFPWGTWSTKLLPYHQPRNYTMFFPTRNGLDSILMPSIRKNIDLARVGHLRRNRTRSTKTNETRKDKLLSQWLMVPNRKQLNNPCCNVFIVRLARSMIRWQFSEFSLFGLDASRLHANARYLDVDIFESTEFKWSLKISTFF